MVVTGIVGSGSSTKVWRCVYLLADSPVSRRLVHEYVEVVEYPDGVIEVQVSGVALPSRQYDRITRIDKGAKIDNKRLASALEVARRVQAMRDDRRAAGSPSRTHCGEEVRAKQALIGLKNSNNFLSHSYGWKAM